LPVITLALAGERREVNLDGTREQPHVGCDAISLRELDDVSGHKPAGLDHLRRAVSDDPGVLWHVASQRLDSTLSLELLNQRECGIEHDHQQHRDRDNLVADREGQSRREPQQQGKGVEELPEQLTRPAPAAAPDQHVLADLEQAPLYLAGGQPRARAPQIAEQQVDPLLRVHDRAGLTTAPPVLIPPLLGRNFTHAATIRPRILGVRGPTGRGHDQSTSMQTRDWRAAKGHV